MRSCLTGVRFAVCLGISTKNMVMGSTPHHRLCLRSYGQHGICGQVEAQEVAVSRNGGRGASSDGRGEGTYPGGSQYGGADEYEDLEGDPDADMLDADKSRKRASEQVIIHTRATTASEVATLGATSPGKRLALPPPTVPPSPSAKQDPKRAKVIVDAEKSTTVKPGVQGKNDPRLAGPREGRRQAQ